MTFTSGGKIEAADYNGLVDDLNEVYGVGTGNRGYGATELLTVLSPPPFTSDRKVQSQHWLDLRNAIALMNTHQGGAVTLPDVTDLEQGDKITAFSSLTTAITSVTSNRLNTAPSSTMLNTGVLTSVRTANWNVQIKHVFTVDFGDNDSARHFFNTGGQIRLTMSAPSTLAAHNWGNIYNTAGTFIFNHSDYYSLSSTINTPINLNVASTGGGVYSTGSANTWTISAKWTAGSTANGARGYILQFESVSNDNYTGPPDTVSGTFTSTIDMRIAITHFPQPAPAFATVTELSSGV